MKDFPQPGVKHVKGLRRSATSVDRVSSSYSPVIRMDSKMPGKITLARERFVAILEFADKGAQVNVVAWADVVGVVDQLLFRFRNSVRQVNVGRASKVGRRAGSKR